MNTLGVGLSSHFTYLQILDTLDSKPGAFEKRVSMTVNCKVDLLSEEWLTFERGFTFQFIQYLVAVCGHTQVIVRNSLNNRRSVSIF